MAYWRLWGHRFKMEVPDLPYWPVQWFINHRALIVGIFPTTHVNKMCPQALQVQASFTHFYLHTYDCSRDVSFQAIAWIQAFMKLKFPHFFIFSPFWRLLARIHTLFQAFALRSAYIPAAVDAGDIHTWRITFIFTTGKTQIPPIRVQYQEENGADSWIANLNLWMRHTLWNSASQVSMNRVSIWQFIGTVKMVYWVWQINKYVCFWMNRGISFLVAHASPVLLTLAAESSFTRGQ